MKNRNLLLALGLSLTLGVSVATGIAVGTEKVQPAYAGTSTTVYCAISSSKLGSYSLKLNTNHKGDGDDWHQYSMTDTGDTYNSNKVFSCTFTDTYNGLGCIQFQIYDGSTWKEQDQVFGEKDWKSASVYNGKIWVYGSTGDDRKWNSYEPDPVYSYSLNGASFVDMVPNPDNADEVMSSAILNLQVGDELAFQKDGVDLEVTPKDSAKNETKVSMISDVLTVVQANNDNIYLDINSNKLWAGAYAIEDGTYLFGTHNEWTWLKSAIKLPANDVAFEENDEFKAINIVGSTWEDSSWIAVSLLYERPSGNAEINDGNVKIKASGNYDVTVDSGAYRVVEHGYTPVADGFYLKGSWDWSPAGYIAMEVNPDGPEGVLSYRALNVDLDAGDEFLGVSYSDDIPTHANPVYVQCDHPVEFPVTINESNNAVVTNGGSYNIYMNKDQNGNTEWGFYLVANDYVPPVYEVKIGSGEKIEMTEGEDNQYFVTGVSVSAGDTIEYFYDNEGVTDSTAKAVNNNNLNESKQVLVDNDSADIYINVVNKTIWVSGMADGGYHIILNNQILVTMTKGDDFEGFEQYYSDSINFAKDDVIRFVNTERAEPNHLPIVFDITTINPAQLGSNFEISGGSIVCKSAVSAMVYLKLKYEADEVFFGEVSPAVARAIEYAEDFMDKIDTACNGGDPDQSTLVTAWNAQKTTYLGLDEAVQTELLKGSESSVQEIRDFAAMYKYVYGRRGAAWGLNNFMAWDIASSSNNVLITNNNGHIALIAIASIIVISTFGFAFFSLKKKRQH